MLENMYRMASRQALLITTPSVTAVCTQLRLSASELYDRVALWERVPYCVTIWFPSVDVFGGVRIGNYCFGD